MRCAPSHVARDTSRLRCELPRSKSWHRWTPWVRWCRRRTVACDMQTLAGRTIAVPETRELDVFASMLERRGATVLRCPLVTILDAPDPVPVLDWIRWFVSGACDDLILLTGE